MHETSCAEEIGSAEYLASKLVVRPMAAEDLAEVALCEEVCYPDLARGSMLEGVRGLGQVGLATCCLRHSELTPLAL